MSANYQWFGQYGDVGSPTTADLGISGNLYNYKTYNDLSNPADYTSYPITAGNNSYDVWLKGHFTGTFNEIQELKYWKSGGSMGAGESLYWGGNGITAYAQPVTGNSTYAATTIPTSSPGSANVSVGGSLAGSLTADGLSDFIVTQLRTTVAAEAGDTETFTFTLTYNEN